jgi:hypothetical protein
MVEIAHFVVHFIVHELIHAMFYPRRNNEPRGGDRTANYAIGWVGGE